MSAPELAINHRLVIDEVWYFLREHGRWPTFVELDRRLYANCDIQLETVLGSVPRGLIHGIDSDESATFADTAEVALTAEGVYATGRGRRELELLWSTVRLAADLERGFHPTPGETSQYPTISSDLVVERFGVSSSDRSGVLTRLGAILRNEPWGWIDVSGERDCWSFEVGRSVRRFRFISCIDDYRDSSSSAGSRLTADQVSDGIQTGDRRQPSAPSRGTRGDVTLTDVVAIIVTAVGTYLAGLQVHWQFVRTASLIAALTAAALCANDWRRHRRPRGRFFVLGVTSVAAAALFLVTFL